MTVKVTLPRVRVTLSVTGSGRKEIDFGLFTVCTISVTINTTASMEFGGAMFLFDITEELAVTGGSATGRFIEPNFDEIDLDQDSGIDIGCIAGFFFDVLEFFTFGLVDIEGSISGAVDGIFDTLTEGLQKALNTAGQDKLKIEQIELQEDEFEKEGILANQELLQVPIRDEGLTGTIGFALMVDKSNSEVENDGVPSTPISPVEPPVLPVAGNKDVYFAASDDVFSLLFAAMTLQGNLITECTTAPDPGLKLLDLLPDDCTALPGVGERGRCKAAKGIACNTLPLAERPTCLLTQTNFNARNISANTELLLCAREPLAPRMLFDDDLATMDAVEALVHINDLQVSLVLDRDGDGVLGQPFLATTGCGGLPVATDKDCRWARACFDLDLEAELSIDEAANEDPQIVRDILGIAGMPMGFQCEGGIFLGDASNMLDNAGGSDPVELITENIDSIVPLFEVEGLNLGGLVKFVPGTRMVLSIDTGVVPDDDCVDCDEFVGVTGEIGVNPAPASSSSVSTATTTGTGFHGGRQGRNRRAKKSAGGSMSRLDVRMSADR